ncbi:mitochondrial carrier superfamily protein [Toxoplasma gondii GAB2-2007-GAL-DOM2]|uniref:Carrier superfamily protein n=5 Tax=Toxoplasma gondii TaxID=5811 RepID=S7V0G4_TOXGG|nr:carrier superfamily protein [Toxoplasma gondii GT1]KAF4638671.1 carrier superfamily protein [Toxoplasma gondii]KFG46396.1 mitochondrial carrier superfamily protein [Toxoplasma gondii GAB2-2007-GAL-DOM2]KFG54169.1 mitochondrial carrier superfamily protein [Toxoplasma gondii FOU]RQX72193.1 carrier superfamily protein [Toxoplasma gondii CAST]
MLSALKAGRRRPKTVPREHPKALSGPPKKLEFQRQDHINEGCACLRLSLSTSPLVSSLSLFPAMTAAASASSSTSASKEDLTPVERMISGMASGILTKTACAPMDRLRLLFQVQGMMSHQQERLKAAPHSPLSTALEASQTSSSPSSPPSSRPAVCSPSPSPPRSVESPSSLSAPQPAVSAASARVHSAQFPTPLALSQQAASSPKKYSGVLASLRLVIQEEGVPGLWRGNAANACRAAAAYAVKFPANDWARGLLEKMPTTSSRRFDAGKHGSPRVPTANANATSISNQSAEDEQRRGERQVYRQLETKDAVSEANSEKKMGVAGLMVAGSIAGALQKALCYPLDLVSVRIAMGINTAALAGYKAESARKLSPGAQAQGPVSSSGSSASSSSPAGSPLQSASVPPQKQEARLYSGIGQCVRRIYTTEGLAGFYKGFAVSLWSGVPYVMLQMTFYELWKREIQKAATPSLQSGRAAPAQPAAIASSQAPYFNTMLTSSVSGSLASFCAQLIVFPFDTARKRLMTDGIDGRSKLYGSCRACLMSIYRREGFAALFAGLWPATLRCLPAGALQFTSYECFKFFFQMQHDRRKTTP